MFEPLFIMKKRLVARKNKIMKSSKIETKVTFSFTSFVSENCFKFFFRKLFSIINNHQIIIQAKSSIFSKRPKTSLKIICEIYLDDAKPHPIRRDEKKKTAKRWIYLSFEIEKKSMQMKKEYEKISIQDNIIFFKKLQHIQKQRKRDYRFLSWEWDINNKMKTKHQIMSKKKITMRIRIFVWFILDWDR